MSKGQLLLFLALVRQLLSEPTIGIDGAIVREIPGFVNYTKTVLQYALLRLQPHESITHLNRFAAQSHCTV